VTAIDAGGDVSCQQMCGYHFHDNHSPRNRFYAVIPDLSSCLGACGPGDDFQARTRVVTHEVAEAVTDPGLNAWFDRTTGAEVGDICNDLVYQSGGFALQCEWSNSAKSCVALTPVADPCAHVASADNGLYCGASTQSGFAVDSPLKLFNCQNGHGTVTNCPFGCVVAPAGTADSCRADPCAGVPSSGNGVYCGRSNQAGFRGGNDQVLYNCQNGHTASTQVCARSCVVAPAGSPDRC